MGRLLAALAVSALVVAACTGSEGSAGSTAVTITAQATTTSVTVAATAAAVDGSAATTAVAKEFEVWIAPPDGTHFQQPLVSWFIWGHVRPEAVVTVNGLPTEAQRLEEFEPDVDPDMWRWSTALTFGRTADVSAIPLEEGRNVLVFEASFADGSTLREERVVYYDPTLQRITGYIIEITQEGEPHATIEIAALEYGEFGLEQVTEDTTITEFLIAGNAVFVVFGDDQSLLGLDVEGLTQLAETAAGGNPDEDLWFHFIYPAGIHSAAPWDFLITPDGLIQQANQLYSP